MLDFKVRGYRVANNGNIQAVIAVYRGDITTTDETTPEGITPVTRFRRSDMLGQKVFTGETRQDIIDQVKAAVRARLNPDEETEPNSEAL